MADVFQGVDPGLTGSYDQALGIAQQYSQKYRKRALTQGEITGYTTKYGGGPGQNVTGAGLNPILQDIWNQRTPDTPPPSTPYQKGVPKDPYSGLPGANDYFERQVPSNWTPSSPSGPGSIPQIGTQTPYGNDAWNRQTPTYGPPSWWNPPGNTPTAQNPNAAVPNASASAASTQQRPAGWQPGAYAPPRSPFSPSNYAPNDPAGKVLPDVSAPTDTGTPPGWMPGKPSPPTPLPNPAGWTTDPRTGAAVWTGGSAPITVPDFLKNTLPGVQQQNQNPGGPTTTPGSAESMIDDLYAKAGITDGGRGSGFADRAYWLEHPSEILNGRLAADLAGTGPDQPTGTPGSGPWQQSGRGGSGSGAGANTIPGGRTTGAVTNTLPGYTPLNPTQTGTAQEAITYLNGISHAAGGGDLTQAELQHYAQMVGYVEGQPVTGDMANKIAQAIMQAHGYGTGGGPGGGGGGGTPPPTTSGGPNGPGGVYDPTNPFDDPATHNYIDFLNSRIKDLLQPRQDPSLDAFMKMIQDRVGQLNTPYTNPDAAPLQEWMRKYFEQLQGPTYTPAQQDTLQTQALDPMERQRQAELKNVAATMASRGITPGSGPYLQAERDINHKFDQLRSQTQSGLAVNEINQGRQNQQLATNVGGQLANFTQGQFDNNENRANQAVSLFGQIPQLNLNEFNMQQGRANNALGLAQQIPNLAQQRMNQAIQLLSGSNVNPAQLLQTLQGFQQQGMNQNSQDGQFWQSIIAVLSKAFGL